MAQAQVAETPVAGGHTATSEHAAVRWAREHGVAENPQWRALLHCQSDSNDSCHTSVASPDFFLSPEGRDKPEIELIATIEAIMARADSEPLQCRFPARFEWLRDTLAVGGIQLPDHDCPDLKKWFAAIQPHSLTVIFPSSFMNNPASAFGHTLLRLDQLHHDEQTRLIAYTANFEANTDGSGAIIYALNGVFGGFEGFFSVAPYYDKVKKYSDLEDRDIWEYELSFSPEEVRRLTLHLWELRRVPFSYYYFDENCSFQLLSLLEVARPSLLLSKRFWLWVIPVDTVRLVMAEQGLFSKAVFRPSLATKLAHSVSLATADQRQWALAAADPSRPIDDVGFAALPASEKISRLDLAYETNAYRAARGATDEALRDARAWKLLSMRSAVPGVSANPPVPPPAVRPEEGHGTARVSVGAGRSSGRWFTEYGLRPTFHDQLDPPQGYHPGSQIKFLEAVARQEQEKGLEMQRVTLLDIESLSPRDAFFTPRSWSLHIGAARQQSARTRDPFVFTLGGGAGGSLRVSEDGLLYALLESDVQAGRALQPQWGIGVGPRSGLILQVSERWRLQAEVGYQRFIAGDEHNSFKGTVSQSFALSKNNALRASFGQNHIIDRWQTTTMLELMHYFDPLSSN